jgi:hypothetical protein
MESHDYIAFKNEKTMFMKCEGSNFIMHGLFVDDMAHASTSQKMINKFMKEYPKLAPSDVAQICTLLGKRGCRCVDT